MALRNATISRIGKSAVSAFTTAAPTVKVADALSTQIMAWRRATRGSGPAIAADVSIGGGR